MLSFVLVVTLVVGGLVLVNVLVEDKLASAKRVDLTAADAPGGGGANYLIIGSDTRNFIKNAGDQQAFGDPADAGGQRSDSIMVLHTDPDSGRATPRVVPPRPLGRRPGSGQVEDQRRLQRRTAGRDRHAGEQLRRAHPPLRRGQLRLVPPDRRRARHRPGLLPHIGARLALEPRRSPGPVARISTARRHSRSCAPATSSSSTRDTKKWEAADLIPDLGRIGRQQAFLREIGARAMSEAIANPLTANDIADGVVDNLTVDQDFGRTDVFVLADGLAGAGDGAGGPESQTVPAEAGDARQPVGARSRRARTTTSWCACATSTPSSRTRATRRPEETQGEGPQRVGRERRGGDRTHRAARRSASRVAAWPTPTSRSRRREIHYAPGSEDEAALVATFVAGPVHVVADDAVSGR